MVLTPHVDEHLRELEARARLRGDVLDEWGFADLTAMSRGLTALFAGPSGCGKTMAAQVLARSLGLDMYRADLAGVVSKYIGETEKHLRQIFDACQRTPVLLLFDEADALFGKSNTGSATRMTGSPTSRSTTSWKCMGGSPWDAYPSDQPQGWTKSTAFVRRLRFIIQSTFPPGAAERTRLWRQALQGEGTPPARRSSTNWTGPCSAPNSTCQVRISVRRRGGAAFPARSQDTRIGMRHLLAGCRLKLEKRQVVVRPGQLRAPFGAMARREQEGDHGHPRRHAPAGVPGIGEDPAQRLASLIAQRLQHPAGSGWCPPVAGAIWPARCHASSPRHRQPGGPR